MDRGGGTMATWVSGLVKDVLDRNEQILMGAIEGLDQQELHAQIEPGANPIGWLLWHLSRVQDNHRSAMDGTPHVWIKDGWFEMFGRSSDPSDRGRGHTAQQVHEFATPELDTMIGYYRAVRSHTDAFLAALDDQQLEREVPDLTGGATVPLQKRLEMLLVDCLQHSGQIAYLRGLIREQGWMS